MISSNLNSVIKNSINFAKELRHEYLTIEHLFYEILGSDEGMYIILACGGDVEKMRNLLKTYITTNIDPLPQNIDIEPYESAALSRVVDSMIRHIQSAGQNSADIGDMIAALFEEKNTFTHTLLEEYNISRLDVLEIVSHSNVKEDIKEAEEGYLAKYSIDLLEKTRDGKIDPVIGRKNEIDRVTQILCRRKKNNPILVGEAGVGKTAIAEGLALNIASGDVPDIIKDADLYALDLSAMLAGT
jgi:ATP-dependent Clp protease ATP-binding subunit ClpA